MINRRFDLPEPLLLHVLNFLRPKSHIEAMREDRISVEIKVDEENEGKEEKYPISSTKKSHPLRDFACAQRVNGDFYRLANNQISLEQRIIQKRAEMKIMVATKGLANQAYHHELPWGNLRVFAIGSCLSVLIGALNLYGIDQLNKTYANAIAIWQKTLNPSGGTCEDKWRVYLTCESFKRELDSICLEACEEFLKSVSSQDTNITLALISFVIVAIAFLMTSSLTAYQTCLREGKRSQLDRRSMLDFYPYPVQQEIKALSDHGLLPMSTEPTVRDFRNQINEALRENTARQRFYLPNGPIYGLFQRRRITPHIPYSAENPTSTKSSEVPITINSRTPLLAPADDQRRRSFCVML